MVCATWTFPWLCMDLISPDPSAGTTEQKQWADPSPLSPASSALAGWALIMMQAQSLPCLLPVSPLSLQCLLAWACGIQGWQGSLGASRTAWDGGRGPASLVLSSNLGSASSSEDWSCDSVQPHLQGIYPPTLTYICCFKLIADVLTSPVIEGAQHLLQQQSN